MRSPYIALGLALFLSACEAPTGPIIDEPDEDAGTIVPAVDPIQHPGTCVTKRSPKPLALVQGGTDLIPPCKEALARKRQVK